MNRRSVLSAAGFALTASIAGCVESPAGNETHSDGSGDTTGTNSSDSNSTGEPDNGISLADEYEQCHLVAIQFDWLPEELKVEVNEAMEDGEYTADRIGFVEAIDPERSYLVIGQTPYELQVDTVGDEKTVSLAEVKYMTTPEPRTISVENTDDREHELELTLNGDELLVDETVTVPAGEQTQVTATDRFGRFDLTARVLTGHESEETFEFTVNDAHFDGIVSVTDETVAITQEVADLAPCAWQE